MIINAKRCSRGYRVGARSRSIVSGLGCTPKEYIAKNGTPTPKAQRPQLMVLQAQPVINWYWRNGHKVVEVLRPIPLVQLIKKNT